MPDNALCDVIVQLTGSPEDEARLAVATSLAHGFDAHLIGAHLHQFPDILDITDPAQSGTVRDLLEASHNAADASFAKLAARFEAMTLSHELRRLHGLPDALGTELAELARSADLFVGTRPYGDPTGHTVIEERVLFGSGRGCLLIPPGGTPHTRFDTVVVAWDGSREAARAIAEAMPLLTRAKAVHLASIAPAAADADDRKLFGPIGAHLLRHGIEPHLTLLPYGGGTGEQLEQYAHQQAADLIVLGAYGHARTIEWIFGGATRHLLRHATLPLLMAH